MNMKSDDSLPSRLESPDHFKLLGDPRRFAILQYLMAQPATLSQLGKLLGDHPAKVRHHLKKLENGGLVKLVSTQVTGGFVEKYYSAASRAYLVNLAILPRFPSAGSICLMGSHDLALAILVQTLQSSKSPLELLTYSIGSLDGLIALRQGNCHLAAAHLPDRSTGQFNKDSVQHLFPGEPMTLITLAHREQGLVVQEGNPLGISDLADICREEISLVNRQPGSGTRVWLDRMMNAEGLDIAAVDGYSQSVSSHLQVAHTVASGQAQVGIGLFAASQRYHNEFIPLFSEQFELVLFSDSLELPAVQVILDHLNSGQFRRQVEALGGYDTSSTGKIREINGYAF